MALADGLRLRAVSAAAGRLGIRAGMTVAESRARCARLLVLPWDEMVIARELTTATGALLAASPQVSAVPGAPGTWWVGASGFNAIGGERVLVRTLVRLARRWHPRARVAIADSCVAARAATWADATTLDGVVIPAEGDAAYLAPAPLALVPMDEELRAALHALGLRTLGAFAAIDPGEVERRWGDTGLLAWRLASGEDRRRPVLHRPDASRRVVAELPAPAATLEPVLFLVRAALDRLTRDLVADARAAAAVAITLALDDARPGDPPHTVTREIRPARPLARAVPLFEQIRALLDGWTLSAPVRAVAVEIVATAPAAAEQGDLLEVAWRDPAAAEAALARLRAELGPGSVVRPAARDGHRVEAAGVWVDGEEGERDGGRETREARDVAGGAPPDSIMAPIAREDATEGARAGAFALIDTAASPPALATTRALRLLESPEVVTVECADAEPAAVHWRGRRIALERAVGPERLSGDWWTGAVYRRDYWRGESESADLVLVHDRAHTDAAWYVVGWYD